jgi:hypothetical protein
LKKLSKAIAMAQWIWLNEIPIDINQLNEIIQDEKLIDYDPAVPSLKMEKTTESINGNTKTVCTSRVFGGVDCQLRIVDMIEEDLLSRVSDFLI